MSIHLHFHCSWYFIKNSLLFYNTFHEFQILKKVIITETFNVDFHKKIHNIWIFFYFSSDCRVSFPYLLPYIYIYINKQD